MLKFGVDGVAHHYVYHLGAPILTHQTELVDRCVLNAVGSKLVEG